MAKIHESLTAIMRAIQAVGKTRRNSQQGYDFRGVDDVANELHALFAEHGVTITPRVIKSSRETQPSKSGGTLFYTILDVEYVFTAEDGSKSDPIVTVGEGMDSGDKSTNKAMSAAFKYAMIQAFLIPTSDPKDSETDSPEPAAARSQSPPAAQPARRQTPPPQPRSGAPLPTKPGQPAPPRDGATALRELGALMAQSKISESVLERHCREVIKRPSGAPFLKDGVEVPALADTSLNYLVDNWDAIAADIKARETPEPAATEKHEQGVLV